MFMKVGHLPSMQALGISYLDHSFHQEYIGSYLMIAGGIVLIVIGLYWAYRIYSQTGEERKATVIERVNRQIITDIQKAKSPVIEQGVNRRISSDSQPQSLLSTALLGTGANEETAYLTGTCDETELLAEKHGRVSYEVTADLNETQYLIKE